MSAKLLKLLLLPGLSGFLLYCSFPRVSQGYLAWIAFVPLIYSIVRTTSNREAFLAGCVAGGTAWFGLLVWIPRVMARYGDVPLALSWVLYLLLVCYQSCYSGLACLITRFCLNRGGRKGLLVFPFAWVALELCRATLLFGGFPWLLAGYSQTDYPWVIQTADIAGVYGISFLILWFNASLIQLAERKTGLGRVWPLGVGLALIVVNLFYGHGMLIRWGKMTPNYTAALLQENLSVDEPEISLARKYQEGYAKMAAGFPVGSVDLLVLPESPSPLVYQTDLSYRESLHKLAERFPLGMIFNNISYSTSAGRTEYYNSAFFLSQNGMDLGRYDKIHLVPFGEYVPYAKLFFFVESISKDVSEFAPGSAYVTVGLRGQPASAIICFEAVFPDLVRRFVELGSRLIVNLTNDGWYGDSAAPYQHLAMARWRAIENRRYLLRATNSGISAIIEPTGVIQTSTRLFQEDICLGKFAFLATETVYTRYGNAFAYLCAIIVIVFIGSAWWAECRTALRRPRLNSRRTP